MKTTLSKLENRILEILNVFGKLNASDIALLAESNVVDIRLSCSCMYSGCLISKTHPDKTEDTLYGITDIAKGIINKQILDPL